MEYDEFAGAAQGLRLRGESFTGTVQKIDDTINPIGLIAEVKEIIKALQHMLKALSDSQNSDIEVYVAKDNKNEIVGAMSVLQNDDDAFILSCGSYAKFAGSAMLWQLAQDAADAGKSITGQPLPNTRRFWDLVTQGSDTMPAEGVKYFVDYGS